MRLAKHVALALQYYVYYENYLYSAPMHKDQMLQPISQESNSDRIPDPNCKQSQFKSGNQYCFVIDKTF